MLQRSHLPFQCNHVQFSIVSIIANLLQFRWILAEQHYSEYLTVICSESLCALCPAPETLLASCSSRIDVFRQDAAGVLGKIQGLTLKCIFMTKKPEWEDYLRTKGCQIFGITVCNVFPGFSIAQKNHLHTYTGPGLTWPNPQSSQGR